MQFIENFNGYDLVPIETRKDLGLYMPILNEFEIQDLLIGLDSKCIRIAKSKYESEKEENSKVEIEPDKKNELKYMRLNAWGVRALPKNLYEYEIMMYAEGIYNTFFATLFLCDKEGNLKVPFEKDLTLNRKRVLLVKDVTDDIIAAAQVRNVLRCADVNEGIEEIRAKLDANGKPIVAEEIETEKK